ncbi:MAG: hypothetical protein ACQEXJ_05075 [Myxococcota bacterium]
MRRFLPALLVAALLSGCDGYTDLDLPRREDAGLRVEHVDLHPGAAGRIQAAVVLPDDAAGPVVVVGQPAVGGVAANVVNWAVGPCPGFPEATEEAGLRLCAAVRTEVGLPIEGMVLGVVVESRGDDRRFTAEGEVVP